VLVMHFPMVIMFVPLVGLTLLGYPKAVFIRGRFDRYIESREDLQTAEADEDTVPDEEPAGADNKESVKAAIGDEEGETVDGGQGVNRTVKASDKTQKKSESANPEGESGGERAGLWQQFLFYHKQEKEKMSDMTKEQKWDYLLTYYKSWFVMGALVLLVLFGAGYHFIFDNAKCGFQCVLVNGYMDKSDTVFSDEISDYFGYEPRRQYAYFDTQYQIAYTDVENMAADTSFYEKFFLNIRAGLLDAAIVPESFMEYCNEIERVFYDVKDVLTEKQVEKYESYFVMGKDEEGNEYVCGIDISGFAFIEKEGVGFVNTNQEDAFILTFPINGQHPEGCQGFVDFLEQYE
ncbi:MAG: hypothetical protein K2H34_02330, partial [Lachnospiraceae bacterium]|nr:hypothetical protein [Lachnospiraceae bacterium]